MNHLYSTKFKGTIVLTSNLKPQAIDKISELVRALNLQHIVFYDTKEQVLYLNGKVDNSSDVVERFILKLVKLINEKETSPIKAQGDDPKDRYDIVVQNGHVYLRHYDLVPSDKLVLFC